MTGNDQAPAPPGGQGTSVRPVAVVTGASSGIGQATALALARRRYALVLAARRADRLAAAARQCRAAGGEATIAVTDVAVEEQVNALVAGAVETFGRLDVMVNNAGVGHFGRVHELAGRDLRAIMETNFLGVFYGCKAAAAIMIRQRRGHIFNVSSVIGKRGTPFHGAYCASKFAVVGLTDAMRVEMMPYRVRVTCVCPALTDTEFFEHGLRARRGRSRFHRHKKLMPAAIVGNRIAAAVGRPVPEMVFTAGGRALTLIAALWPRAADALMKVYHDDLVRSMQ